ncbi:hypothetical protein Q4489_07710 [Thalassotalea sp. 1_MG-2023]|uniref:hypothetical protein n=1 Tax=Thalassotalea sp. 1_MG-2023 TaxID=3062680 RepID=UPI0026E1C268|nr:hypothetical protein [Thalassotalea sp. 1_MG-2023]MDO6426890.1 hypothetical protein [Thalassotalea sp. 1_MG-2023]
MNKMYRNFFLTFIFLMLVSCTDHKPEVAIKPICIEGQSACVVEALQSQIQLTFNQQRLVAETPFIMRIDSNNNDEIIKVQGYMEGENMYMGKIPLIFIANSKGYYEAQGFVGSCGYKDMQWRIWITITDKHERSETLSITVPSYLH